VRLSLITPTPPDICAFGIRSLSAFVKSKGHRVTSIFLPTTYERWEVQKGLVHTYPDHVLKAVVDLAKGSDLVGISLMTNYFDAAVQVTKEIQSRLDVPVIWGGAHPTVMPLECLDVVEMICIGEGEEALLELLERIGKGETFDQIQNLWLKRNGRIIKNPIRPLIQDLDALPFYDFDLADQYVIDIRKHELVPLDHDLYRQILPKEPFFNQSLQTSFRTYTSRGCPHHCAYCINWFLKQLYPGQRYLRMMGVERVIQETESLLNRFPYIETFVFFDDTFLARSEQEIAVFSDKYRDRIGLPFRIQVSPSTISPKKMTHLVNAGLVFVEMGLQSGSKRTKRLYMRHTSNERIVQAAHLIHSFQGKTIPPRYHVILDNPWEEAMDVVDTLRMLGRFPKPFSLARSSLVLYPGTPLFDKGMAEGRIRDPKNEIYRKNFCAPSPTYVNLLIHAAGNNWLPRPLIGPLSDKRVVGLLDKKALKPVFEMVDLLFRLLELTIKGYRAVIRGDVMRIYHYVKMRLDRR
jgi:anaerobic magnesium-protoporphyrin IX monomethyl ester cyclase